LPGQLEWFKKDVNDKSTKVQGGLQRIKTVNRYIHPINIIIGLADTSLRLYTDDEWDELPMSSGLVTMNGIRVYLTLLLMTLMNGLTIIQQWIN
jgi:hypothetical protein